LPDHPRESGAGREVRSWNPVQEAGSQILARCLRARGLGSPFFGNYQRHLLKDSCNTLKPAVSRDLSFSAGQELFPYLNRFNVHWRQLSGKCIFFI
jgi:hypothetical protein